MTLAHSITELKVSVFISCYLECEHWPRCTVHETVSLQTPFAINYNYYALMIHCEDHMVRIHLLDHFLWSVLGNLKGNLSLVVL